MATYSLKIDEANRGLRLDIYLTRNLPDIPSRTFVQRLIEEDGVFVNGRILKANYKVSLGDAIEVTISEAGELTSIKPQNIALDIFYEDDDLLIINKPVGLCVHPGAGQKEGTMANALVYHFQNLSDVGGNLRPGIVHRLDQETSGLILIAKNNNAHAALSRQFEERRVQKCYVALVKGIVDFDEGIINAPIGRHPRDREKQAVYNFDGREAETIYKVMKRFKNTTLVALFPQTGRTHQLRVHMAHIGHPIMGDEKYGRQNKFPRLALHARVLGFYHPATEKYLEFSSLIPPEFFLAE